MTGLQGTQDTHVFLVEVGSSPLKGLSRAWSSAGADSDLCPFWGYKNNNYGEWVGRIREGDYYQSVCPLFDNDTGATLPVGTHFVAEKVTKDKPFIAEDFIREALDEDLVGDHCVMKTLHPETGEPITFCFWANQQGFPQFKRIDNEMAVIAIAATGL
jgi:hypothetical protein